MFVRYRNLMSPMKRADNNILLIRTCFFIRPDKQDVDVTRNSTHKSALHNYDFCLNSGSLYFSLIIDRAIKAEVRSTGLC